MSKRDQAAALVVAGAAVAILALAASGQETALGHDPYTAGPVRVTGEVVRVETDRVEITTALGRTWLVETEGLEDAPRDGDGDLALEPGDRLVVEGLSGAPLLKVNMIAATALTEPPR
ncbi:MAG: hypothetical protein ABL308_02780 [Oceanicaulis sp.]